MKIADILADKVKTGQVDPRELPKVVVDGVRRHYAETDHKARYAEAFAWAEVETAKSALGFPQNPGW